MNKVEYECPARTTLDVIGGKWKLYIVYHLSSGAKRYGQLKRLVVGITEKMLRQQLGELQADGVVFRKAYGEVPPRVEYSLTPLGKQLTTLIEPMQTWGTLYVQEITKDTGSFSSDE